MEQGLLTTEWHANDEKQRVFCVYVMSHSEFCLQKENNVLFYTAFAIFHVGSQDFTASSFSLLSTTKVFSPCVQLKWRCKRSRSPHSHKGPSCVSSKVAQSHAGETAGALFCMNLHANQYLTSISIGKQYFPFYLAIIVLNAVKYLIVGLAAKERPVTMATMKAIGFLFSRIMNFSPLCVTLPLHSQPLRLNWSPRVLEIPRLCLIICQTRGEKKKEKKHRKKCSNLNKCITLGRGVGISHSINAQCTFFNLAKANTSS